jgi:hypothetical protein
MRSVRPDSRGEVRGQKLEVRSYRVLNAFRHQRRNYSRAILWFVGRFSS